MKVRTPGIVQRQGEGRVVKTTVEKDPTKTKEENDREAETTEYRFPVNTPPSTGGGRFGTVSWGTQFTLSRRFQSIRVECSVQIPWEFLPGDLQGSADQGLDIAKEIVGNKIAAALSDQEATLTELIEIAGGR